MYYMISNSDCAWCDKAIDYIKNELKESVKIFFYTEHPLIFKLMKHSGLRTVPQIWKEDQYIGGYEDLIASNQ